jgi:hypothetical protein
MRVIVTTPGQERHQLDTPDPQFVGAWLKLLFDSWLQDVQGPVYEEFRIEFR